MNKTSVILSLSKDRFRRRVAADVSRWTPRKPVRALTRGYAEPELILGQAQDDGTF